MCGVGALRLQTGIREEDILYVSFQNKVFVRVCVCVRVCVSVFCGHGLSSLLAARLIALWEYFLLKAAHFSGAMQ